MKALKKKGFTQYKKTKRGISGLVFAVGEMKVSACVRVYV